MVASIFSTVFRTIIPNISVPAAPTVTLTPSNGQISIAWVDGSNGGATITAHTIYVNGAAMLPITSASPYVLTGLSNGTSVNIEVSATNSAGEGAKSAVQSATPVAAEVIGGVAVGTVGGTGTLYDGYTMSGGDDFTDALSIIGPSTPRAKYATTRGGYIIGGAGQYPRGSNGLGSYDADPLHTGFNDSNRGAPVSVFSDSIVQTAGELTLKIRQRTAGDNAHMRDAAKSSIGAMIHTGLSLLGRPPVIFEWREKRTSQIWSHNTGWLMQANGYSTDNDVEIDVEAASDPGGGNDGREIQYNINNWTNGSNATSPGSQEPLTADTYVTFTVRADENGTVTMYRDGVLKRTYTGDQAKVLARSYFFLLTAHAYAAATVGATPATITVDWLRVWRKGGQHYVPLVAGSTYQTDFGVANSWTLPTQAAVWGGTVTEVVEACMLENNEPGGTLEGATYTGLPTGVTYNSGTRALAIANTVTQPGRLHIARYVDQAGSTCEPQRILIEVGPKINIATQGAWLVGSPVTLDVYAACDVGNILPKVLSVTGLPAGLSFSSGTGLVTGTPSGAGSGTFTVTCTNAVGQQATANISYTVSAASSAVAAPTLTGSPSLLASWDFADNAKITNVSGAISQITGSDGTAVTLSQGTAGQRPIIEARNGRQAAKFTAASSQFLNVANALGNPAALTFVAIMEPHLTSASFAVVELGIAGGNLALSPRHLLVASTSTGYGHRKINTTGQTAAAQGSAYGTGRRLLIGVSPSGTGLPELNVDGQGTAIVSTDTPVAQPSSMNETRVGGSSSNNPLNANMWCWRILVYSGALTATQREEIAVWAASNYGTANNA